MMKGATLQKMLRSTAGSTGASSTIFPPLMVRAAWVRGFFLTRLMYYPSMRNLLRLALCCGALIMPVFASTVIQYQVANLGSGNYQYTYYVSGNFNQNQEFDIQFDASVFGTLSNPTGPSGWDLAAADGDLTQPQGGPCSPCAPGDFAPFYMNSAATTGGIFTLDFTLAAAYSGPTPGSQPFSVQQFDPNGVGPATEIDAGTTTPYGAVPEPASWALSGAGLLVLAVVKAVRRAAGRTA